MRALLERIRPFAPLTLRLALAALFAIYGQKLLFHDMPKFQAMVVGWGLPKWVALVGAWSAFVGGALMGIGFLTRLAALLCGALTALVLIKTKLHSGWAGGLDLPILSLAACLSLLLSGAGRWSIDDRLFN